MFRAARAASGRKRSFGKSRQNLARALAANHAQTSMGYWGVKGPFSCLGSNTLRNRVRPT
jgi:hypothetical protein